MRRLLPLPASTWAALAALATLCFTASPAAQAGGFTASLRLAHPSHPLPATAPSVVAHASARFDPTRPFDVVLFLHGWSGCVQVLVLPGDTRCTPRSATERGWGLAERFDAADGNLLLLAPQLAYLERDGSPGRFARAGFTRAFLVEALAALGPQVGGASIASVRTVTVVAHSAGFMSALAVARQSGLGATLDRVALMDALYDVPFAFAAWAAGAPSRTLVSLHTGGRTERNGAELARRAVHALGAEAVAIDPPSLPDAVRTHRVTVARVRTGHVETLRRYLPDVLARRRAPEAEPAQP